MPARTRPAWPILLALILLVIAAMACNATSGGDDDDDGDPTRTSGTAVGEANIPTVTIQAPDEGAQVLVDSDVLIFAVAQDAIGVTRVELLVNDFVVASQSSPDLEQGEEEFEVLLRWQPRSAGTQRLEVIPWRDDVRGEPAVFNLVVRASRSEITQTAGPTISFLTPTQVADNSCRVQVTVGALSVRSGPGLVYDSIDRVTIGQSFEVTGRQLYPDQWWQIYYNGRYGWVSSYYVTQLGDCTGIGIVLPPPTPTLAPNANPPTVPPTNTPLPPTPTPIVVTATPLPPGTATLLPSPEPCRIRVNQDGVPVFSGPGGNYTRMTLLSAGQQFSVVARNPSATWWQIAIAGTYGWVQTERATLIGETCGSLPTASIPPTPTATATRVPRPTESPNRNPSVEAIPNQVMNLNEGVALQINAIDPDNDSLSAVAESSAADVVTANVQGGTLTLEANGPGTATITVRVQDDQGGTAQTQFTVTVASPNNNPQIEAIPDQRLNVGEGAAMPINATDPDGDSLTASAQSSDPNVVSANVDGGTLTLQANGPGTATITVRVTDENGGTVRRRFTVTVASPNREPRIESIPDQRLGVGDGAALQINAIDPDNDSLTASAESSDPNVVTADVQGGTLTIQANNSGTVTIIVRVQDEQGSTAQTQFTVRVSQPNQDPQIETITNQRLSPGEGAALQINATDPENGSLSASAESSDPNVVSANVQGGTLTLQANNPGRATITVRVQDDQGGTAQTQFTVRVVQPNQDPQIEVIPDQRLSPGDGAALQINATDPDNGSLSASAESSDPNIVTADVQGGTLTIQANNPGTATITIRVQDEQGGTAQIQFNVRVVQPNQDPQIEAIPDQRLSPGEGAALQINATDPDNGSLSASAESSDPNVVSADVQGGTLTLQANNPGTATITVRVQDDQGGTAQTQFTVRVSQPNQDPQIETIPDQRLSPGEGAALQINATDPDNGSLTASAESSDPNVVTADVQGGTLTIQANNPGNATITVRVQDEQGGTAQTQFTVRVVQPNQDPQIEAIPDQRLSPGEGAALQINATDPDNGSLSASAESSDPNVVSATVDGGTLTLQANNPGTATITIRVQDDQGGTAQTQFNVRVVQPNQDPQIEAIPDQRLSPGEGAALQLNATDPDNDSLTASAESSDPNVVTADVQGGTLTIQANNPGNATITVRVQDDQGGTAQIQFNVRVVQPNQDPQIEVIPDQRLSPGEGAALQINATDPDNGSLSASAESSDPNIVTADVQGGTLTIQANNPGNATVTVRVQDEQGGTAQTQFNVRVVQPNQDPQIEAIPDQRLNPGEGAALQINATDPDNGSLSASAESSDPNVVTANVDGGTMTIQANNPGRATITVRVQDDQGGTAQIQFNVRVVQPNQDPQIEAIPDQTFNVGDGTALPINASDPEGEPLSVVAESSDANVVVANTDGATLTLQANNPGNATITVRAQDAQGRTAQIQFNVTVQQPAQQENPPAPPQGGGNLSEIPVLSQLEGEVARTVRQTYRQGQNIVPPANPTVFSVVGDTPPAQFLGDLADSSANFEGLSDREALDDVVFYYASATLPLGGNSFQNGGTLSTNPNWATADLLDPAKADQANCPGGVTPLDCELTLNRPSVVFVSVGRNDVLNQTPMNQFRRRMRAIVEASINQGAIPVLMTIPGLSGEQQEYNNTIVQVAAEYNVPLINLWRQIAETAPGGVNPDLTLTSPGANDQFTPGDLANFGVPNRNLLVLRMLAQLRASVPIP